MMNVCILYICTEQIDNLLISLHCSATVVPQTVRCHEEPMHRLSAWQLRDHECFGSTLTSCTQCSTATLSLVMNGDEWLCGRG